MKIVKNVLEVLDKMTMMLFVMFFSYLAYLEEAYVCTVVICAMSIFFLCFMVRQYKNKAIIHPAVNIFVIVMMTGAFVNKEEPMMYCIIMSAFSIIDLVYDIILKFCK